MTPDATRAPDGTRQEGVDRAAPPVRHHPRFRVTQARGLRSALARATIVLAIVSAASGGPLIWLYPRVGTVLALVGLGEAVIWAAIFLLLRRVARRYLAFISAICALLVLPGPLLTIIILPAQYPTTLAYLTVIPLAIALFVPWSIRAHGLWLIAYVGAGISFAMSPVSGSLPADQRLGLALALAAAGLMSFVGQRVLQQGRERQFAEHQRLRAVNAHERALRAELSILNRRLAQSARLDPLTGIANRLQLAEDLLVLWDRHVRYRDVYAAVLLDLDRFKTLNDQFGHLAGDAALRAVAAALRTATRPSDGLYRFGGEEFLVVLREAAGETSLATAARLVEAVASLTISHPDNPPWGHVTISAGVALLTDELDGDVDAWLRRADQALYRAKANGRNCVEGESVTLAGASG